MIKLIYPKFWSNNNLVSTLLTPFSWIYIALGFLRKSFTTPLRLDAKTICVGNVTVGGTGKTQIVELLARHYKQQNKKILIITKGYGSSLKGAKLVDENDSAENVGDEAKLLSKFAKVVSAQKIKYAVPLINEIQPEIIIFDDGLQNPGFIKDCSLLVIDNMRGLGNKKIIPSGSLRENIDSAISKSNAIICIGDNSPDANLIAIAKNNNKPVFKAKINLISEIKNINYLAFSAIGNPDKFFSTLETNGATIKIKKAFPDHHQFTEAEMLGLKTLAKKNNCTLITTKKDYVKINDPKDIECAIVDILFENKPDFIKFLDETLL